MEQFLVPQFLDVEPKVIGPITVRQFILMMVGLLFVVIEYKLLDFGLFLLLAVLTLAIFGILAFFKINGRPFHYFLLSLLQTLKTPNLRVWNKDLNDSEIKAYLKLKIKKEEKGVSETYTHKPITKSRLTELSLIVNTGGAYQGEEATLPDLEKKFSSPKSK